MEDDPKVHIYHRYEGQQALAFVKKLFYPNSPIEADIWATEWTNDEISGAVLCVYSRFLRKNFNIGFSFRIGQEPNRSFIAEEHEEVKGKERLQSAGIPMN